MQDCIFSLFKLYVMQPGEIYSDPLTPFWSAKMAESQRFPIGLAAHPSFKDFLLNFTAHYLAYICGYLLAYICTRYSVILASKITSILAVPVALRYGALSVASPYIARNVRFVLSLLTRAFPPFCFRSHNEEIEY